MDDFSEVLAASGFAEFTEIRLCGVASTAEGLRAIVRALAFVGVEQELRVGIPGDDSPHWSWRTPLLPAELMDRFIRIAEVAPIAFAASRTTPGHGNLMVASIAEVLSAMAEEEDDTDG